MRKFIMGMGFFASLLAGPAVAQSASVLVATGPGVAGAAETVSLTGSITEIDAATREVALIGPGGGQMVVEAGPEVKNFAQLKVGDRVDLEITRALSLELRKGSTAEISRTDEEARVGAEAGKAPGGAAGRKVVIMSEVTAVDAATQTVTLTGPKRSLALKIGDPEQFKAIAVGDRVEATYVEAVAVAVTPAAAE